MRKTEEKQEKKKEKRDEKIAWNVVFLNIAV